MTLPEVAAVSFPGPEPMLQLTPWLAGSLATVALKLSEPPIPNVPLEGTSGLTLIALLPLAVSGTVTDADLVGSVLLVAVTVAEVPTTGVAAVYKPLELIVPVEVVQVTPALAESLATAAVKVWVAPAIMAAGVSGLMATVIAGAPGVVVEPPPPLPQPVTSARARASKPADQRTDEAKIDIS